LHLHLLFRLDRSTPRIHYLTMLYETFYLVNSIVLIRPRESRGLGKIKYYIEQIPDHFSFQAIIDATTWINQTRFGEWYEKNHILANSLWFGWLNGVDQHIITGIKGVFMLVDRHSDVHLVSWSNCFGKSRRSNVGPCLDGLLCPSA
jgi:hypothetical protein